MSIILRFDVFICKKIFILNFETNDETTVSECVRDELVYGGAVRILTSCYYREALNQTFYFRSTLEY